MRFQVIDPNTNEEASPGRIGLLRIVDLANLWSVLAVLTQDLAIGVPIDRQLVSCPRNTRYFTGGQLAVFQGAVRAGLAVEAPRSESYGSSEQRGKTADWPRPKRLR
jgi:hypothetical protein